METTKILAATVASAFLLTALPAVAGRVIPLSGMGTSTGPDRSAADSEALDQATSMCVGTVVSTSKTTDSCIKIGSDDSAQYACTVMGRAMCELAGR